MGKPMGRPKPLPAVKAEAVALYRAGVPSKQIYIKLGISHTTLSRWLKSEGIQPSSRLLKDPDKRDAVVAAYREGKSVKQIVQIFGVHKTSVYSWLAETERRYRPKLTRPAPLVAKSNRAARCIWILKILSEAGEPIHDTELAVLTGAVERTIERDLKLLTNLGARLERSPRGVTLLGRYQIPLR